MREGWETRRLCELGSAIREHVKIASDVEYELWSVPSFETGAPEIADGKQIGSAKLRVTSDDVLICKINPRINRVWLVTQPENGREQICSTEWLVFRTHSRVGLSPSWLIHYVSAPKFREWIESEVSGATGSHTRAKADDIMQQQIPVPPLSEQRRIVEVLDEAFAGLAVAQANAAKNLQNARALFESHLQAVFSQRGKGWVEKRLGELFKIGSSKRVFEKEWTRSGIPFYGGREVVQLAQTNETKADAYISEEKYTDIASRYGVPVEGDILMTARGTIGTGYIVKKDDRFYYKDGNIIYLHPKEPTEPRFVLYAFKTKTVKDQLANLTGATVTHLPIEKANSLVVAFPSYSSQHRVVNELQEIEAETQRLTRVYEQKQAQLAALKKSLLHQAFNGEL